MTGYPWAQGDVLLADDLNEAIANSGGYQAVNVMAYGATGDGVTDDTAAINAATAYIRANLTDASKAFRLVFPRGNYLVLSPLNFTNLNQSYAGVDIVGEGAIITGKFTGGAIIDALNSRWLRFWTLGIRGDATTVPKIGLQIGRGLNIVADYIELHSVKIYGNFTFAAFYNLDSEQLSAYSSEFRNDRPGANTYCMVQDGLNHWNAMSSFITVTAVVEDTSHSFNSDTFFECTWQSQGGTACVWSGRAYMHKYINGYASNTANACFVLYQPASGGASISSMVVDVHMETAGLAHAIRVTGPAGVTQAMISGLSFADINCQASTALFGIDPACSITFVELRDAIVTVGSACRLFDVPSQWYCNARHVSLSPGVFNPLPTAWRGRVENISWPGAVEVPATARVSAVSGASFAAAYNTEWMELFPSGTIAAFTVTLPPGPGSDPVVHGRMITISTSATITALTVNVVAGQTVSGQPGTLTAFSSVTYRYDSPTSNWFCQGKTT